MTRAYLITYLGPTNTMGARMAFDNPRGKRCYIPRNYSMSAEKQAETLAKATQGFISFASLEIDLPKCAGTKWVYLVNYPVTSINQAA